MIVMKKSYFLKHKNLQVYFRYVDDTFAIFGHEAESDEFLITLNCLLCQSYQTAVQHHRVSFKPAERNEEDWLIGLKCLNKASFAASQLQFNFCRVFYSHHLADISPQSFQSRF